MSTQLREAAPYLIQQDYSIYTEDQHQLWSELVARRIAQLRDCACREYLQGWEIIGLEQNRMPDLPRISKKIEACTGWQVTPVSGFMPSRAFFEMLAARQFPTTTWLRDRKSIDYTPEPDILHDVLGHLPMYADQVFADGVQQYGEICYAIQDEKILERLGRLYWFTVEFGLIKQGGENKIYGSGLASSHGECTNVLNGGCEVRDFDLEEVLNTHVRVDVMQPVLFAVKSFEQVFDAIQQARQRLHHPSAA
jgi:phenylalanine-4-hydroxylase